ncbi:chaperonin 10-like protein [Rhodocollybia butyracea]|uniref:Chaperonin 10-like protein n=1 Tax=Rhodocollybia butyracea TaxID=206335 RepID=A0A9P5PST8_9AGAR|nr:chaperonin 10-like protein [Rhodocollybia butyracea]
MRAILIKDGKGPIENLYLGEAPEPVLKHGQVMVKIKAFGLNRMDILQRNGNYAVPAGASDILGVEFSGTVSSLGEGTTKFKVGDEGAYAEYIVVSETHLLPKPSHLSWVEAASIPEVFLTGTILWEMKEGESVLVHAAASGLGLPLSKCSCEGAKTVIATASTRDKLDWLSHWNMNIESMARDGRMTNARPLEWCFNLGALLFKRLRIQGSTLRSRTAQYQADLINKFTGDLLGMITGKDGQGPIKTYIHKVYSWKDIQDAHRDMEGNQTIGKLIVVVD